MFAPGPNTPDRGIFSRPFIFGVILLLLFLTATTEVGPAPQRQSSSLTLRGNQSSAEDQLRDEIVYKLSVANAQLEKENRLMRIHLLELRKIARECKGANFTTDLQRAYRLSDLKHLRGPSGRHHRRGDASGQEQVHHQGQPAPSVDQASGAGSDQPATNDEAGGTEQAIHNRLLLIGSPFEKHRL